MLDKSFSHLDTIQACNVQPERHPSVALTGLYICVASKIIVVVSNRHHQIFFVFFLQTKLTPVSTHVVKYSSASKPKIVLLRAFVVN